MGFRKAPAYDRSFKLAALERLVASESLSGVARALGIRRELFCASGARRIGRVVQRRCAGVAGRLRRRRQRWRGLRTISYAACHRRTSWLWHGSGSRLWSGRSAGRRWRWIFSQQPKSLIRTAHGTGGSRGACVGLRGPHGPAWRAAWRTGVYDLVRGRAQRQGGLSVAQMCTLLGVSRAGYYRHWRAPAEAETALRDRLQQLALAHRHYGCRRLGPPNTPLATTLPASRRTASSRA